MAGYVEYIPTLPTKKAKIITDLETTGQSERCRSHMDGKITET